tara:strand:- start:206 stop:1177 length:972 start_codon:yes stop_codon:yes gene_type:complete
MNLNRIVNSAFSLAERNWNRDQKPHAHFQNVPSYNHIKIGHNSGKDIIALAPSMKANADWYSVSTIFEVKIGKLEPYSGDWDNCLQIQFESKNRRRMIPFICDLFSCQPHNIDDSFDAILDEWKRFFDKWDSPLSREEQIGLFGELTVLQHLLEHGPVGRVDGWLGPSDSLHDFQTNDWHLEVKTSTRPDPIAWIHPDNQLQPIEVPFSLVVVKVKKGEGTSLPEKIDEVYNHSKVSSSAAAKSHIDNMLEEIGYSKDDAHHYPTTYQKDSECIHMDANASETTLFPSRVESSVKYDDLRWRLLVSDHAFSECDDDFWKDPAA